MARIDDFDAAIAAAGFDIENAADRQSLARVVGCDPEDRNALGELLRKLQTLALAEWLAWATARRRFNSLSELDADRVLGLFLEVRQAAPTVELLVEELAIPQGRATSLVGRMKYGKARQLIRMSYVAAERDVRKRLEDAEAVEETKTVFVSGDILERIREVETDILLADGTVFPAKEKLNVDTAGRRTAIVTTSTAMWNYVLAQLKMKATQ